MNEKIKVGIVTTPEGAHFFNVVLNEFQHVESKMMIYQNDRDVRELIQENQSQLDVIVFSGPLGYHMNRKYVNENTPTICVGYNQIELIKGLLPLSSTTGIEGVKKLSIDTFNERLVAEVYEELGFQYEDVFVKEFNPDEHHSDIVEFHVDLWNRQKILHVITARRSVYSSLMEKGIPAIKVLPTKFSIRDVLFKAVLLGQNSKNIESQITVCMFSLLVPSRTDKGAEYEMEKRKLDFHRALVDFAHKIDASIVPSDSFEFILYTNRGYLEEIMSNLKNDLISGLERVVGLKICVGLGLGKTALSAQSHARQALRYAKTQGGGCGYLVRNDGKIVGPLGTDRTLQFEFKTNELLYKQISEKSQLSIDTVSKIIDFAQKHEQFTAEDLAYTLNVTARHVRNIINHFLDLSYIFIIGEERPYPKGRPRRIYALRLEQLTR